MSVPTTVTTSSKFATITTKMATSPTQVTTSVTQTTTALPSGSCLGIKAWATDNIYVGGQNVTSGQ